MISCFFFSLTAPKYLEPRVPLFVLFFSTSLLLPICKRTPEVTTITTVGFLDAIGEVAPHMLAFCLILSYVLTATVAA